MFSLFIQSCWNILAEITWKILLETDLYLLLPLKQNSNWTWTYITLVEYEKCLANFATNYINVSFLTHLILSDLGKLNLIILLIA